MNVNIKLLENIVKMNKDKTDEELRNIIRQDKNLNKDKLLIKTKTIKHLLDFCNNCENHWLFIFDLIHLIEY